MPVADTLIRDQLGRRLEGTAFIPTSTDCVVYDSRGQLIHSFFSPVRFAKAVISRELVLKVGDVVAIIPRGARR